VDCVVASLSLHHVADLDAALDRLQDLLNASREWLRGLVEKGHGQVS
jgi:hypothetical protein